MRYSDPPKVIWVSFLLPLPGGHGSIGTGQFSLVPSVMIDRLGDKQLMHALHCIAVLTTYQFHLFFTLSSFSFLDPEAMRDAGCGVL